MKSFIKRKLRISLAVVAAAGCGSADRDFKNAAYLEKEHRYPSAVVAWERFVDRHPREPRAAEALVRAARIYAAAFGRCAEAKPLYERAAREYADREPWSDLAKRGLLNCPDYFPIRGGEAFEYVDSQTGGRNMRLTMEVRGSTDAMRGEFDGAYYAGAERFKDFHRTYAKENWAVYELEGRDRVPILKFPYSPGSAWTGRRGGREVEFRIESDRESVKVKAGAFADCLKVREFERGARAWKYDYYAPGTGKVKTTIGTSSSENPNTELKAAVPAGAR